MFPSNGQDQATILHLRVKSARLDPLTTQLRLASLLSAAQLGPAALGPAAILCIRQFHDPLPGRLSLHSVGLRPPPAWENAVGESLGQVAQRAARPIHSAVPANVEAVLFADRTELLACLANDWLVDDLMNQWWWRSLMDWPGGLSVEKVVKRAWLEALEYVPGAFEHMARRSPSAAIAFVRAWAAEEALDLLARLTERFGLIDLHTMLQTREIQFSSVVPWLRWAPESAALYLISAQSALLGISLMLHRAPTEVRSAAFARAVGEAFATPDALGDQRLPIAPPSEPIRKTGQSHETILPGTLSSVMLRPHPELAEGWAEASQRQRGDSSQRKRRAAHRVGPAQRGSNNNLARVVRAKEFFRLKRKTRPPLTQKKTGAAEKQKKSAKSAIRPTQIASVPSPSNPAGLNPNLHINGAPERENPEFVPTKLAESALVIFTEFGGVFYLINLGIYLGYYADFTTPLTPGIALSIWDFLALVGRELLGESIEANPVWPLLAQLAGRAPDDPPGRGFESSEEALTAPEWIASQMPLIRRRLQQGLGLSPEDDLPGLLCRRPARVEISAAHLDIFFSLADLPIEIRLSGLDRDPGWVPAAGRYVAFHFDE